MSRSDWDVVIGLEIHVQLLTKSKIFSGSSTQFGAEPNTQASAIDLGMPGVLPVVNIEAYRKAVAFGLGVGAQVNTCSAFDRKNYFYPDSPKGYQITQLAKPIVEHGIVEIPLQSDEDESELKTIRILRAHLEEDAGKSVHEEFHNATGIDLNRAGTPLLEIVSEPDLNSAKEAVAYAKKIHQLVTYLGVSDGDMSQGSLRCDANVSLKKAGATELGTRTETKNVNSFRFLEQAIEFEIDRQMQVLESGGTVVQETRLYDPDKDETRPMRSKETATDYRYFPEPDLLPIELAPGFIEDIRRNMPELPEAKAARFASQYALSEADSRILASTPELADYFEEVAATGGDGRLAANWVRVETMARLNKDDLDFSEVPVAAKEIGYLVSKISNGEISGKIAKTVFDALWQKKATSAEAYITSNDLNQVSDTSALAPLIDTIIAENPKQVEQFKAGKTKLMGFFVGQVMKQTQGKANPQQVNELLLEKLKG